VRSLSTLSIANYSHQLLGYWGYDTPPGLVRVNEGEIVSFSAAGLNSNPDIWAKNQLNYFTLAREPFGKVSCYYLQVEKGIWFASRLQILLPLLKSPRVSIPAFYGYICFSYVPNPLSPVEEILTIPAGVEQSW